MRPLVYLYAFLCLVCVSSLSAQQQNTTRSRVSAASNAKISWPAELMQQLSTIRDAALVDDYAYRQTAHLTENIGPRPTGSPQAQKGVEYVAEELRKLGLEVRLEEAKVPRFVRGVETAELVEYAGQAPGMPQKIVVTALGGNVPTPPQGITAEVVVVNNFDELKALGSATVKGKIVVFNEVFDTRKAAAGAALDAYGEAVVYRSDGAKEAAAMGAVASLVRSVGGAEYRIPHTGYSKPAGIPAGAVTAEDADLISHLVQQGVVRMHLVLTAQLMPDVTSYNVVADLKGSERPEQIVVVSGHLDSWDLGTGAVDDAAGVAVAMETAQLLKQLHLQPKRTIRVIAWMDEETGGKGSDAYTKAHQQEFGQHIGVIESDLGAEHPLGLAAKISPQAAAQLAPVQEELAKLGANLLRLTTDSPGADISTMAKEGVPAFGILQEGRTYFDYHHTAADTLDKIVPEQLRENAAVMAVLAYALATMPQPLPRL